jgi:hypothetical protein
VNDDALAYLAITRLQNAYAGVATRQAWDELEALFVPGAVMTFHRVAVPPVDVPVSKIADFAPTTNAHFEFFEFATLNTVVSVGSDGTARGRFYQLEVGQDRASGQWSTMFGVFQDEYALYDGQWRFAGRQYQSLARRDGDGRAQVLPFPDHQPL